MFIIIIIKNIMVYFKHTSGNYYFYAECVSVNVCKEEGCEGARDEDGPGVSVCSFPEL